MKRNILVIICTILLLGCDKESEDVNTGVSVRIEIYSKSRYDVKYSFVEDGQWTEDYTLNFLDRTDKDSPFIIERNDYKEDYLKFSANRIIDGNTLEAKLYIDGVLVDEDINDVTQNPSTAATFIYVHLNYSRDKN